MKLKNQGMKLGGLLILSFFLAPGVQAKAHHAAKDSKVKWYVNINRALMNVNDGNKKDTYFVDNNDKSSRVGLLGEKKLDNALSVGGNVEVELISGNSATINQLNRNGTVATYIDPITGYTGTTTNAHDGIQLRQVDTWIKSDDFGKLSLGHGSMASWAAETSDLSGTVDTISYAGTYLTPGGMYFHNSRTNTQVAGNEPTVGEIFSPYEATFTRQSRVRYDTPEFAGFTLSAAMYNGGQNTTGDYAKYGSDAALRYAGCYNGVKMLGAIGYNRLSRDTDKNNQQVWNGSFAALHVDSGINAAVDYAQRNLANPGSALTTTSPIGFISVNPGAFTNTKKAKFGRIQLGIKADLNCYGKTNFIADFIRSKNALVDNDKGTGYGIGVVQQLKKVNSEVYFSLRRHKYTTPNNVVKFNKMITAMAGLRVSFGGHLS